MKRLLNKISNEKRWFFVISAVILVVLVFTGRYFYSYTQDQLYNESVSQLKEVSTHLLDKLDVKLDTQWDYLAKLNDELAGDDSMTEKESSELLSEWEQLLAPSGKEIKFRLIDEEGHYFTNEGMQGMWTGVDKMSDTEKQSFIIANWLDNENYMTFVSEIKHPLKVDGHKITHVALLRSMEDMKPFFSINAYYGRNVAYIIDTSGTVLSETGNLDGIDFSGRNIFHSMEKETFLHMDGFDEIVRDGESGDTVCTDVMINGSRYYVVYNVVPNYDWSMVLLVGDDDVAVNATHMVASILRVFIIFTCILLAAVMVFFILISRFRKNRRLLDFKIENERILEDKNTQLKKSQHITEMALSEAESATKAKSQFLANMSHDIRTPMNAIVGVAKLMENYIEDTNRLRYYIRKIQNASQYMLGLINDILDMSKIEAGEVNLNAEPLKVADQVGQIESIIRPQADEKGHKLTVTIKDISHEYLIGDSVRLRQVFLNLLTNAVKYTPNGGQIRFEIAELACTAPDHARFRVAVTDNGNGMTKEFVEHIFEPFTREESSTTNRIQGTGLGMCITKNIVDLMDGTITVESEPGKGSRFEVEWEMPVDTEFVYETSVKSLLLLSANEELADNVRSSISCWPVKLYVTADPDEAADVLRDNPDETVLIDNATHELVERLRGASDKALLIACCDYEQREKNGEIYAKDGVDGFVLKPFFFENLITAAEQARAAAEKTERENHSPLKGRRFICAEDNELNAEILEALLKMHDASCVIYPNGEELVGAFASVRPGDFDAVLMDVQMPVMNGLDATRAIRESENPLGKTIPIIAMTANAFDSDVRECLAAGMDMHIAKPIDITALERAMQKIGGEVS